MNKKRSNDLTNTQRHRSDSNSLTVPNSLLVNNNIRKMSTKNMKNGNLSVDSTPNHRRRRSSNEVNPFRTHTKPFQTTAIEMQTLYTPNDF